mgnify:CR=1 FL=1
MTIPAKRMMKPREAAEYCGIPFSRLPYALPVPRVEMPHGKKLYDRNDLDAWLDGLKSNSLDDDSIIERLGNGTRAAHRS